MNESQAVSRESWQSASEKAVQQTTTHWDPQIQSNPLTRSASTANISLRSSGKSSAGECHHTTITGHGRRIDSSDWLETSWNHLGIWADWFETSWNHLRIWAHKSRNHPCSVSHGTVSVSHGTPWYPILLSFKMQLPTMADSYHGKLSICAFAGHGAGFLTRDLTRKITRLDQTVSLWALGEDQLQHTSTLNIPVDSIVS